MVKQLSADEVTINQSDEITWARSFGQAATVQLQEESDLDKDKGTPKWSESFEVAIELVRLTKVVLSLLAKFMSFKLLIL